MDVIFTAFYLAYFLFLFITPKIWWMPGKHKGSFFYLQTSKYGNFLFNPLSTTHLK